MLKSFAFTCLLLCLICRAQDLPRQIEKGQRYPDAPAPVKVWIVSDSMLTRLMSDAELSDSRLKQIKEFKNLDSIRVRQLAVKDSIAKEYKQAFDTTDAKLREKIIETGELKKDLLACKRSRFLWAGALIAGAVGAIVFK
ncbi:MAG: hypothetical protein CV087_08155 [Candidatus Brocadia sp. WS118]|nr:MAG: hypothetical protein CV087_08155 [Candidatus Brocadia sp. WS118]